MFRYTIIIVKTSTARVDICSWFFYFFVLYSIHYFLSHSENFIGINIVLFKKNEQNPLYCHYYQAHVMREQAWFFVAVARSYEHVMFDRTFDVHKSIFEFFVPVDMEVHFLEIMNTLQKQGVISDVCKMDNRLLDPSQIV